MASLPGSQRYLSRSGSDEATAARRIQDHQSFVSTSLFDILTFLGQRLTLELNRTIKFPCFFPVAEVRSPTEMALVVKTSEIISLTNLSPILNLNFVFHH